MNLKLITAAALALSFAAAPALAQDSGSTGDSNGGASPSVEIDPNTSASTNGNADWTDAERTMYGESDLWAGFYTDNSMTTLKSDAEIQAMFSTMGADDQAGIKASCDRVNQNRGSFGSVTTGLCAQVGQM
ncbi:MAG: hypothetical protein AB7I79_02400 [Rhizobiaceae bacterium]